MARDRRSEHPRRRPARPPAPGEPPRGRSGRPGSPRARLFVALDPAPEARAELAAWRDAALAGEDAWRPVREELLHVTLAFLGYLPERRIAAVAACVEAGAAGATAPLLEPRELRGVPPRAPRLVALDLADEDGRCGALAGSLSERLAAERLYEPERRPFWPHVTLARLRRGLSAAAPAAAAAPPPPAAFSAPEVVLYRSHLRREGARYEPLARVPLA